MERQEPDPRRRILLFSSLPHGLLFEPHAIDESKLILLVQLGGLEPPTSCSTDRRSNQLSYNCILAGPQKGVAERGGN